MANIKRIKKRVKTAQNISQITRAMQMVAASKMRKAQEKALLGRPYQEKIFQAVSEFSAGVNFRAHPLLRKETLTKKVLVVLISSNKGLCGGLNTNLFRALDSWFPKNRPVEFITVGKKGESFIVRTGRFLLADFSSGSFLESVPPLTQLFSQEFIQARWREVYLLFNKFITSLKQEPRRRKILPLGLSEEERTVEAKEKTRESLRDFLIEPSAPAVLNSLLPHYLEIEVRNAILETEASEHSARMIAMKNATDNANSLIDDLTLEYNRLRQERITYEIADMVTARSAVE